MNPQEELDLLNNLIDELLAGLQDIIQSGEILSDEFQGAIAQELEQTTSRIDQLRQEIGQQRLEMPIEQPASDGSKLLWILSGSNPETFVSYLNNYPDQDFRQLLSNPTRLQQEIEQLQSDPSLQMQPGQQQDGIPKAGLQSSNVYGAKYDPKTGKLLVRFQTGSVYEYGGIPPYIFKAFQSGSAPAKTNGKNKFGSWWVGKNPSLGASLNEYIKKAGYPYKRLS